MLLRRLRHTVLLTLGLYLCIAVGLFAQRPLGIDISVYQPDGNITWSQIKSGGITFAWAKATEGTTGSDSQYTAHMPNGKAVGIYMGSYHYAHPELNTAASEAAHFWSRAATYTKNDGLSLMPMLDIEGSAFSATVGDSSTSAWINDWCNIIVQDGLSQNVVLKPNIYISACNANHLNTTVSQWGSDIAHYDSNDPQTSSPWSGTSCSTSSYEVWGSGVWTYWQYTSTGGIPGYSANIDHDVYNGTAATLVSTQVVGGGGPQITNQPDSITVALGTNVSFAVGASGTSIKYQWKFNSTNIAGATTSAYNIANVAITNAGNYTVVVTNSGGANTSSYAYLSVIVPPTNAPDSILAPTNLVNWWDGQADTTDSFGTANETPHGNFFYQPGRPGLGYHFNGSNTYLTSGATSLNVPWTLMLWVNRQNAPGASAGLLSDGTYSFKLEQYNGTRQVGITHAGVGDYTFPYVVPANTWTHLAFVGTSTGTSLYVNGALQSSLTNSQPLPRNYMGVSYFTSGSVISDYMLGTLDEIMTFNRAMSASEISAVYNTGAAGLVRAPEVASVGMSGSNVILDLRGITGKSFSVYSSPDLTTWTFVGRYPSSTGTLQLFYLTTGSDQTFYKVAQP